MNNFCPKCGKPVTGDRPVCQSCGASLPPALPTGTVLRKNGAAYRVGAVLGQGGFGITYKGVDERTGRSLAIKEFFPAKGNHFWAMRDTDGVTACATNGRDNEYDRGRMSFLKEAKAVAKLDDSPQSIVKGVDYLEANGTAYLVLEFLPGQPLYKTVRARPEGKMTPQELFPKLLPLMDGITWIHNKGIVHRDICPDNIMFMPNGELCLTDFGSAREMGGKMTEFFKPRYAPIEQETTVVGPAGPYSDVYTLAASAVYCLTGQDPQASTSRLSVTHGGGPDPLYLPDCLSEEQKEVFRKAMAIRPKDRYQTMAEFKKELIAATPWLREKTKPTPGPVPDGPATDAGSYFETHKSQLLALILVAAIILIILVIAIATSGDMGRMAPPVEAAQPGVSVTAAPVGIPARLPGLTPGLTVAGTRL